MARRSKVRLQWDPDHYPNYDPCYRKAVQLGIRGPVRILMIKSFGTRTKLIRHMDHTGKIM